MFYLTSAIAVVVCMAVGFATALWIDKRCDD